MTSTEDLLKKLQLAIIEGSVDTAKAAAQSCLEAGIPATEVVEVGLRDGLRIVGEKFEKLELFLPDMMASADVGNEVMKLLEPAITASNQRAASPGTAVVGVAKGDIHTIGKNILVMLLKLAGFTVHDLGENVSATTFLEEAKKVDADVIAISALMTSTMPGQREVIKLLQDTRQREEYFVLVGGAPVTRDWASQIGADGYSETAAGAVNLALSLVAQK